jgi:hypothetical protein
MSQARRNPTLIREENLQMFKRHMMLFAVLILLVGMGLSLGCVYISNGIHESGPDSSDTSDFVTAMQLLFSVVLPVGLVICALIASLKVRAKSHGLVILVLSYATLLCSFSSAYYSIIYICDYQDAEDQSYYYHCFLMLQPTHLTEPVYRTTNARAFNATPLTPVCLERARAGSTCSRTG